MRLADSRWLADENIQPEVVAHLRGRGLCLDRLIFFGERRLLRALDEFVAHYHRERNHQGLGNELITPETRSFRGTPVRCRERLGGLLRYYHRAA